LEAVPFILIGLVAGYLIERLFLKRILSRRDLLAGPQADKVVLNALRGMLITWGTLAGAYLAILNAQFDAETTRSLFQLLQVPFIMSITVLVMRLGVGTIEYTNEKRGGMVASVSLSRSLTSSIILILGVLILLQALGISITPIIATLGITGLAVSLALEETLSNVFSGLYIIFSKQMKPGDYVRLKVDEKDHVEGYITDITWRSTTIRTLPWRIVPDPEPSAVIVPNSRMAADIVVMHNRPHREIELLVDIGVSYGSDLEHVEIVTVDVANEVMREMLGKIPDPIPVVRYRSLGAGSVNMTVVAYGSESFDHHWMRHELVKRLYRRYEQEGIDLALSYTMEELSRSTATIQKAPPTAQQGGSKRQ
jgi:small-conductance mechanosensitive channel